MSEPIPITVKRYICPHCRRGRSSRKAAVVHIGQCWRNPANRSCNSCHWYMPVDALGDERCAKGLTIGKARETAIEAAWLEYSAGWHESGGAPRPIEEPHLFRSSATRGRYWNE
jgi:hypothetical protein